MILQAAAPPSDNSSSMASAKYRAGISKAWTGSAVLKSLPWMVPEKPAVPISTVGHIMEISPISPEANPWVPLGDHGIIHIIADMLL